MTTFSCPTRLGAYPERIGDGVPELFMGVDDGYLYFQETDDVTGDWEILRSTVADPTTVVDEWPAPSWGSTYGEMVSYEGAVGPGTVFYFTQIEDPVTWTYTFLLRSFDVATETHATLWTSQEEAWPSALSRCPFTGRLHFWAYDDDQYTDYVLFQIEPDGTGLTALLSLETELRDPLAGGRNNATPGYKQAYTADGDHLWFPYYITGTPTTFPLSERGLVRYTISTGTFDFFTTDGTYEPGDGDGGGFGGYIFSDGTSIAYAHYYNVTADNDLYTVLFSVADDGTITFVQNQKNPVVNFDYELVTTGDGVGGSIVCPEIALTGFFEGYEGGAGWSQTLHSKQGENGHSWFASRNAIFRYGTTFRLGPTVGYIGPGKFMG